MNDRSYRSPVAFRTALTAESDLRAAAAADIGDWFRFEIGNSQVMDNATRGARIPVSAYVGATQWAKFHIDLVGADVKMTGVPEDVPSLARVAMPTSSSTATAPTH